MIIRNITKMGMTPQWVPVHILPDDAYLSSKEMHKKGANKEETTFSIYHAYAQNKKTYVDKGDICRRIYGPKNGWIYLEIEASKKKMWAPYWVMPHELRTNEDLEHRDRAIKSKAKQIARESLKQLSLMKQQGVFMNDNGELVQMDGAEYESAGEYDGVLAEGYGVDPADPNLPAWAQTGDFDGENMNEDMNNTWNADSENKTADAAVAGEGDQTVVVPEA